MQTLNTIFSLPLPAALSSLPQHFNPQLRLWEHLLNQKYGPDFVNEQIDIYGVEEAVTDLVQHLINTNSVNIYHPETGEIIWEL